MKRIFVYRDEIFHNQDPIFYILSYIKQHSNIKFTTELFDLSLSNIINVENSYLFFSIRTINEYILFEDIIYYLRQKFKTLNLKIVLGGVTIRFLDYKQILEYYPEVSHIVVGSGEEITIKILSEDVSEGVHEITKGIIKNYTLDLEYYDYIDTPLLYFDNNRCINSCKFCERYNIILHKRNSVEQIFNEIEKMYIKKYRVFYIFDNILNQRKFVRLLEYCLRAKMYNVRFIITGGYCGIDYEKIYKPIAKEWKKATRNDMPIHTIAVGLEIYSQDALNLYGKKITTEQIDNTLKVFNELNINYLFYILHGLPGVSEKSFFEHKRWIEENSKNINSVKVNYFQLSSLTYIYKHLDQFKIRLLGKKKISEMMNKKPRNDIDTEFYYYELFDEESNKYLTMDELIKKYDQINYYCHLKEKKRGQSFKKMPFKWKRLCKSSKS